MRKLSAAVASAVLLGALTAAPGAWAHGDAHDDDFTLFAKVTDFDKEDNGDDGPSEGDEVKVRADLYDKDWDEAGEALSKCEVTEFESDHGGDDKGDRRHSDDVRAAHSRGDGKGGKHHGDVEFSADCWAGFDLDDGKILAAGEITEEDFEDGELTFDIEKGTDDFEDAEGTVEIEFLDHDHDGKDAHGHGVSAMHEHGDKDHRKAPVAKVTFNFDD